MRPAVARGTSCQPRSFSAPGVSAFHWVEPCLMRNRLTCQPELLPAIASAYRRAATASPRECRIGQRRNSRAHCTARVRSRALSAVHRRRRRAAFSLLYSWSPCSRCLSFLPSSEHLQVRSRLRGGLQLLHRLRNGLGLHLHFNLHFCGGHYGIFSPSISVYVRRYLGFTLFSPFCEVGVARVIVSWSARLLSVPS